MKRVFLTPLAAITVASFTLWGCASSDKASTAYNTNETTTMAGNAAETRDDGLKVLVIKEEAYVPVATLSVTALAMENPVPIDEMFEDVEDTEQLDVLALARTSPNLSTFVKLIEQAKLEDDLQRMDKITLFAPTNEAFARIPKEKLEALISAETPALLSGLLQAHILSSEVTTAQLEDNTRIGVSDQRYIPVERGTAGSGVMVGGAHIVKGNVEASNGRIHVIDKVILPSEDFRQY